MESNFLLIGNGFDIAHNIKIKFSDFISWIKSKNLKSHNKIFCDDSWSEYVKWIGYEPEKWSDLEGYLYFLFKRNSYTLNLTKKINTLFAEWFSNIINEEYNNFKHNEKVLSIMNEFDFRTIISLNYTNTPSEYGYKPSHINLNHESYNLSKLEKKFVKIHYISEVHKFVIGHDLVKSTNKNLYMSKFGHPDRFKTSIFKDIMRLDGKVTIHIFGFSFGKSDSDLIENLKECSTFKVDLIIYVYSDNEEDFEKQSNKILSLFHRLPNMPNIRFVQICEI